jgi:hypothetical protein
MWDAAIPSLLRVGPIGGARHAGYPKSELVAMIEAVR